MGEIGERAGKDGRDDGVEEGALDGGIGKADQARMIMHPSNQEMPACIQNAFGG